jgi:hypothetical protein
MTTLTILFGLLMALFILLAIKVQKEYDVWATMSAVFFGIGFIVVILFWVLAPLSYRSEIKQFEAFKATLSNARELPLSEFERAAIQSKIADWNGWLADKQYTDTWLINCVPDEVNDLEPIK